MKLINAGSLNLDTTYYIAHMVKPGETEAARYVETVCGGKGLNQSVAAAEAGADVYHAGIVGEDGEILIHTAKERGVNTDFIRRMDGKKSGRAVILLDESGQNSIVVYRGTNYTFDEEYCREFLKISKPGDFLLIQNEINDVPAVASAAKERGLKIVWNPSPFEIKYMKRMMEITDFLFINEIEGEMITEKHNPIEILNTFQKMQSKMEIILTVGAAGAYYQKGKERIFFKGFPVETIDTTAAGDTFTGYFLAEKMKGGTPAECLRIACAAAALAVNKKGAVPSIPKQDQVLRFLERQGRV